MTDKRYSELSRLQFFDERFDYLSLGGTVGITTFGFDRWINQRFYSSKEWRDARDLVIIRDNGCDLGVPGREIHKGLLIHHINPMSPEDIMHGNDWIINPEFLITTCHDTHNAIHYGDKGMLKQDFVERTPGDTTLW